MGVRFTSADGSFVLTGVGAGSVYRIMALADGHGEAAADRVTAAPRNRLAEAEPVLFRSTASWQVLQHAFTHEDCPSRKEVSLAVAHPFGAPRAQRFGLFTPLRSGKSWGRRVFCITPRRRPVPARTGRAGRAGRFSPCGHRDRPS